MGQRGRAFTVRFWGVRAAIAAPGPETVKYGGNTPCVEVRVGDELLIIDCGTGMRDLGNTLMGEGVGRATILISRYEWDHIQGFPFFVPAFIPGTRLTVLGLRQNGTGVREKLAAQMDYPCFPVKLSDLGANIDYQDLDLEEGFEGENIKVVPVFLDEDEVVGFKVQAGRKRLVYLSRAPADEAEEKAIAKQVRSSVLIYGLPAPVCNGHDRSDELWQTALSLAERAKAKQLIIFDHAPELDDEAIGKLERRFRRKNKIVSAAYEGMSVDL